MTKPCHGCGEPKIGTEPRAWYCLTCQGQRSYTPGGRSRAPHIPRRRPGAIELAGLIRAQQIDGAAGRVAAQRFRDAEGRRHKVITHHAWATRVAEHGGSTAWDDPTGDAAVILVTLWEETR